MTENVRKLLDNLSRHNSRAYGYELSQNEVLKILKLFDDVKELEQYRAIGTVEELQRQKEYIDTINEVCSGYSAIGTIEEFKALKENQRKCEDCAGCTNWKCDCANERDYAITQFANFLHEKAKENNGLRLSSETRSWTHLCIFDYLEEFKNEQICKEET